MGDLLGDLASLWNAMSSDAATVFSNLEDVMRRLSSLGVPSFPHLEDFIRFLVSEGENPFILLPTLVNQIISRGGNVVATLETLAIGFLSEGPQNYIMRLTNQIIDPLIEAVQKHTETATTLGNLHQSTISQIQQKLQALHEGTPGTVPFQGETQLTIQTQFTTVATSVNQLTAPLTPTSSTIGDPSPQFQGNLASINGDFIWGLQQIPAMSSSLLTGDAAIMGVLVLVAIGTAVATEGVGDVVVIPVEAAIMILILLGEAVFIVGWFVGDCLLWILKFLAIVIVWGIKEIIYHIQLATSTTTETLGGITVLPVYNNPSLNPDQTKLLRDLKKWLADHGVTVPESWLKYLIGLIGTTGASIAAIRAMILCLSQKGFFDPAYAGVWNKVVTQLEPDDLQGAWKDGCGMKVQKGGRVWTHWDKVNNAYDGLQNFLNDNPSAPEPLIVAIQATLKYINEVIDRNCKRNKNQWKDQARGPFWSVLLKQSGCARAGAGK